MTAATLREAVADGVDRLAAAGVPSPRHDAEELASFAMGCERNQLWHYLPDPAPGDLNFYLDRRAAREPLQHITGRTYFRQNTLAVGPGVFIPRPETEVVVDAALRLLAEGAQDPVVVDLCAGSGAIALAIATEHPGAHVHAVESSSSALPWLRRNLDGTGVTVHAADIAEPLPALARAVDLVVANPPYIPLDAIPRDREVAEFDPTIALFSGVDGLDHIRLVERAAARLLKVGGHVVVEHADVQGAAAPALFAADRGWVNVTDHQDLNGRDRFLKATRSAHEGPEHAAL